MAFPNVRVPFPNVQVPFPNIRVPFPNVRELFHNVREWRALLFGFIIKQNLPNLTCLRAYSQRLSAYSQPEGKGPICGTLMSIFFRVTTNYERLYTWSV